MRNYVLPAARSSMPHLSHLPPKAVSLGVDNEAIVCAISRQGYPYQVSLLRKATSTLLCSRSAVQVGWTPNHTSITSNGLADAAAKLAAEGTPSDKPPWSYSNLRSQIRSQLLQEWQVWHKLRDDFPFSPPSFQPFYPSRHAATRLFQM